MSDDPFIDLGHKVFFVKPSSVVQKEMVAELIRQEYEVYLVPEVERAKKLFLQYPDCLAFLNIDEGLSEQGWQEFVAEVQQDERLKNVKLGILTYNKNAALAEKYLMEFNVAGGFIKLSLGLEKSTEIVLKVLEANEAKGRRRYLRVKCGDNTKLNFMTQFGMIEGKVVEISSVGMSCILKPDKDWKKNSVVDGVQLKLKNSICLVDGVIIGSRQAPDSRERHYVIVFDPKTSDAQKDKIRAYKQWALQAAIDAPEEAK